MPYSFSREGLIHCYSTNLDAVSIDFIIAYNQS